ncbi:hypothetical protein POX_g08933 [Penicillium oxalicum]|uniref:hypothetical protein n=1 Tax=Penicillium oxalicum TaxID=69781 RepID=UPI0020B82579|nr:hypothetical protein POX_g08933 [Penicillium oxalicum]KAI2786547.1 hypothetical protein POX_g08933 [Penicillium oxalicum]
MRALLVPSELLEAVDEYFCTSTTRNSSPPLIYFRPSTVCTAIGLATVPPIRIVVTCPEVVHTWSHGQARDYPAIPDLSPHTSC